MSSTKRLERIVFQTWLWLSLVLNTVPALAQKTDLKSMDNQSLKQRITQLIDDSQTENLEFEERITFVDSALKLSIQNNFSPGMAESYYTLGKLYFNEKKYLQALDYLEKSVEIYDENENWELGVQATKRLGWIYFETGDYTSAIDEYFKVLRYFEKEKKDFEIAGTYNNIGIIFHRGEVDYEKALDYYNRALSVLENLPESETKDLKLRIYTNIGLSYFEMNDYEKAETFFLKSIDGNKELQNKHIQIVNEGNLGLVYSGMKDYKKAETYFDRAIGLSEEISDNFSKAINTADLGKMYLIMARNNVDRNQKKQLLKKSIENIQMALEVFKSRGDYRRYQGFSEDLSEAYELEGNYQQALRVYKINSFYKDSLFSDESSKALARQEISYEFSKRVDSIRLENEKRMAVKDAVLVANKKQRNFLIISVLLLLAIGGLLYYQNIMRKSTNEKLSRLNEELKEADRIKMQFFGIINHDLRSPISNIIKLLRLQQNPSGIPDADTQKRLQSQTVSSAENLLSSMEDLLLWSKGQMKNFQPEFKELPVRDLFSELSLFFENLPEGKPEFHNSEELVLKTDENYLKTITRNLTLNALKALENIGNPKVIWKAYSENGAIVLSIEDNGSGGLREDFRALYDDKYTIGIRTGLGLHLIRDLAKAIHCTVSVESEKEKGTTIFLIFQPFGNS